jgi:ribosomal protein S18 acetylase RimI-like enzyme
MLNTGLCENLPWDSDFFNLQIARIISQCVQAEELKDIFSWCHSQSVDCLYLLVDIANDETVRLAEDNGFRLVDIRVLLDRSLNTSSTSTVTEENNIGPVLLEEIPSLALIAETSYEDSRFYHDVNFPRERCAALYKTWIEKSCHGYADAVLVARINSVPIGYISCHLLGSGEGKIGLVGVHQDASNRGIGRQLVGASLAWFQKTGVNHVTVVTQGRNWRAQRLYQRCGFLTRSMHLWYHHWFKNDGSNV